MLNLLKFRTRAAYEDGRDASGAEAYAAYGRESEAYFRKYGGRIAWAGSGLAIPIAPNEEMWDRAFIAVYPSRFHFLDMARDEGYRAVVFHRQAALENSRLVAFAGDDVGQNAVFG